MGIIFLPENRAKGTEARLAVRMGVVGKAFDIYEKEIVGDG